MPLNNKLRWLCIKLLLSLAIVTLAYAQKGPAWIRLILQTHSRASQAKTAALFKKYGAMVQRNTASGRMTVVQVPATAADHIREAFERSGLFTFVEKDQLGNGSAEPNDPRYASQWHLARIEAAAAWNLTVGSGNVPIAILDSGVDASHPELTSRLLGGWSYLSGNSNTSDVLGHGTAVAGAIGAATNNLTGVAGVTWSNPLLPFVVLNSSNYASYADIASAIYDATDRGARIINISIGGSGSSSALQTAVNYAWSKGAVVFAAAMNNGTSTRYYPAACDKVVAVSATNSADGLSSFSNYGSWIDVSAPGESILTTSRGGGYGYWSGTSFASPIAAGVAALVLTLRPSLGAADLVNVIGVNADDLGLTGSDPSFGRGRVNAYRAVLAATTLPLDAIAPLLTLRRPDPGATVSGIVVVEGAATDNMGLARVELLVDGAVTSSSESASFSFQWNSASVVDGVHTISVKVYDFSGNSAVATASVSVTNPVVPDNISPTIEITSPRYGSFVTAAVPITVSASDNIAVTQVNIYIDDILHYSGGTAPYAFKWNTKKTAVGLHTITATAWDAASNHAIASPIVVTRR